MMQIPEHLRVIHAGTSFGPERQGTIRYMKSKVGWAGLRNADNVFEEHFNW
jgi:hypothetical protein